MCTNTASQTHTSTCELQVVEHVRTYKWCRYYFRYFKHAHAALASDSAAACEREPRACHSTLAARNPVSSDEISLSLTLSLSPSRPRRVNIAQHTTTSSVAYREGAGRCAKNENPSRPGHLLANFSRVQLATSRIGLSSVKKSCLKASLPLITERALRLSLVLQVFIFRALSNARCRAATASCS